MQRIISFLLSILFICAIANAQTYNFINFNVGDGLEQADILAINQTNSGFLLYGTNGGGLGIYNGYSFSSIKEKQGLTNNVVFSIAIDTNENIWCATNSGVSLLNNSLTTVRRNYLNETPFYVSYSKKGKTYFGNAKGLYVYDSKLDSIVKKDFGVGDLDSAWISSIFIDSKQNTWIGTQANGLFKINNKNKVVQYHQGNSELSNNYIKTIIEGKNNDIFIGTISGLCLIKNNKISVLNTEISTVESGSYVTLTSSIVYGNHIVFGALNTRLYFVDLDDYTVSYYTDVNGFNYKRVWSVFNDNEGNLWLGTIGTGLVKYIGNFSHFNQTSALKNSYIYAIHYHDSKIYVANRLALQIIENNKVTTSLLFDLVSQFNYVYDITAIKDEIYLSTNKGLFKLKGEKFIPVTMSAEVNAANADIYTSFQSKNTVYFGGKNGVYQLKNDTLSVVKEAPKVAVYNIIEYNEHIYFASENGIYKLNGSEHQFIGSEEGLVCTRARSFVLDNDLLWIGTNNGIYIYDGKEIAYNLSDQEGLSSENIYFLSKDKSNNIWAGTNKGVDKVSIASVYAAIKDSTNQIEISNYNKNQGFGGLECNMNAVEVRSESEMLFGTINGLFIYNKDKDIKNEYAPVLSLNNIKLNFIDVDWSEYGELEHKLPKDLSLTYKNNNLIFEYVGISLTNPNEVVYQYKLEGLDNSWLPTTIDQKAVYTAIPPGNYTFMLKARNSDNVWSDSPLTFSFSISPPWWQTTWFYILTVSVALLSFYLIMRYRTRMLKKEQQILTQKVNERTKELLEEKEKVEEVNSKLESQNQIIEIANKNITDSINYAQKIQEAVLPKAAKLKRAADFFSILFIPKDVVSGDFYWFDDIDNKMVFAAADCTGHGVPGALMSMIGINNLNQIVLERKITQPDVVLKEMNNSIKKALKQDDQGSESRDGMDIVFICVDYDTNILTYAGAFRPLVYVRDNEIFEIKGSRRSIGGDTPLDFSFESHTIPIQEGDVFYLYSDGYPDQFGGPKNKKLMNKRLRNKFIKIHKKTPEEQRELLLSGLNEWKGNNEQVDDILVAVLKF